MNWEYIREIGASRWAYRTFLRQFSKRVLRRDMAITLPTGPRMHLPRDSKFATDIFISRSNVDWGSEEIFLRYLAPDGAMLDVGANIGYYALYMLPRVASVHAFEPDPRSLQALRQNLADYPNAHVHPVAVGNRTGTASFVMADNAELSHISAESAATTAAGQKTVQVPMTTIDAVVRETGLKVTGIKIDVEGVDLEVLEGATETLRTQSPLVLTEADVDARLFDLVTPLNYRVFAYVRQPKKAEFTFHEIFAGDRYWTKMLFLAPPRLAGEFARLVS